MSGFPHRVLVMIGVLIASQFHASSSEPTANLVALIPPEAGLVAGMEDRRPDSGRPTLFIPLPEKSWRDVDYFESLCGADPAKSVNEVILVDGDLNRANYDHTLLARGRFNSGVLYKSASRQGAIQASYRGLTVLQVPPLAGSRSKYIEFTWLAVIDSRVLLLGTPEHVRQEMDRLLAGSAPDPSLAEQITSVYRSDVWWVIRKPFNASVTEDALKRLSPELSELLTQPDLQMGMRYGRQAVFEYQVGISEHSKPCSEREVASDEPRGLKRFAMAPGEMIHSHGVIKISRDRYRRWIAEISTHPMAQR